MYMYESNVHLNTHINTLHCNVTLCGCVGPVLLWHTYEEKCVNIVNMNTTNIRREKTCSCQQLPLMWVSKYGLLCYIQETLWLFMLICVCK